MGYLSLILMVCISMSSQAQLLVGTGFSYQGELLDDGTPANGLYDMEFTLFDTETSQTPLLIPNVILFDVVVSNGLFNIPSIDFNFIPYYQGNEVWMEVAVRKSSENGDFEALTSRQRIGAVPYAYKSESSDYSTIAGDLVANGAASDDILTYDGTGWRAKKPGWTDQNNILSTSNQSHQVTIGNPVETSSARLTVHTDEDGLVTKFIGSGEMHNEYLKGNMSIGYVGSIQDGTNAGTTTEDFEVGTTSTNLTGNMHLTIQEEPKLTIANNDNIGIIKTTPSAKLDINIDANDNVKPVKISKGGEIFGVHANAGVSIGDSTVPPDSGLYSTGDVKQSLNANGLVKFMLTVNCAGPLTSIYKQYNGINNDLITVDTANSNNDGFCQILFPPGININDRYYVYSTISGSAVIPTCTTNSNPTNRLLCANKLGSIGKNTELNLLVY